MIHVTLFFSGLSADSAQPRKHSVVTRPRDSEIWCEMGGLRIQDLPCSAISQAAIDGLLL